MILDRIAIEEAGTNPTRQAAAIHTQLDLAVGPAPVFDIARALDIADIRVASLKGFEAALVTTPERDTGAVLLNEASSPQRRNFSLAHELGHFLNPWHRPIGDRGFECSRRDMIASGTRNQHIRQEAEANRFAIELLAPPRLMKPFLAGGPDLAAILVAGAEFDISKAAAARRYVELHDAPLAIVFSHKGKVTFVDRSSDFPFVELWTGDKLPKVSIPEDESRITDWLPLDPDDWLQPGNSHDLLGQTLSQVNDHAMTLLSLDDVEDDG